MKRCPVDSIGKKSTVANIDGRRYLGRGTRESRIVKDGGTVGQQVERANGTQQLWIAELAGDHYQISLAFCKLFNISIQDKKSSF
jgi:hypothetical protein